MFKWVSASIPSLIASAVVYAALTALVIKPLRKGGYEPVPAGISTPVPQVVEPTATTGE